jgi:ketosteroid isomerase-like protein
LQDETVHVAFDDVKVEADSCLAVANATVTYAAISAEGEELRFMQNRTTWVFTQGNGDWKIAHEHTSVPVGHDDLKAILKRGSSPS